MCGHVGPGDPPIDLSALNWVDPQIAPNGFPYLVMCERSGNMGGMGQTLPRSPKTRRLGDRRLHTARLPEQRVGNP